ncbi:MAG: tail fiber protein [Cytophagales bacterium]|nr:tail fiber protein [Cytophagales bacterium]
MTAFLCTVMGWAPNFAPRDWAYCHGALLAISSFTAIYSLVGTIYGGDGRTTFALPDLRGRALIGQGAAPGMQPYIIGYRGGLEFVTLNIPEMPAHNHTASLSGASATLNIAPYVNSGNGTEPGANGNYSATTRSGMVSYNTYATTTDGTRMGVMNETAALSGAVAVGITGNSNSHENRTPYQVLNWIFCTQGVYPSRN